MSSMESQLNRRRRSHNLVQGQLAKGQAATKGQVDTGDPDPSGKSSKRPPLLPDTCYRCGKGRHQKAQNCKAVDTTCRGCGKKGHYEKVCLQGKCSAYSLETPQATSAGAGANEPLYFNDEGQPVYTYMVSVPHTNKHLIKFPVTLEPTALRRKGTNADSSPSTSSTPSVLLKADTGADINLMNKRTFDRKVLKPTPIRMENYGNSTVKVLGMFHAFLRWKDRVYRQLFYVTDCDRSPNLLSRDACYTLGVLKPCYMVEKDYYTKDYPTNCECMCKR